MIKLGLINSNTLPYNDSDISAYGNAIIKPGVKTGMVISKVSSNVQITAGKGFFQCTRSNGDVFLLPFTVTSTTTVAIQNSKKLYLYIPQANIDNPTLNVAADAIIQTVRSTSYPGNNYFALCSTDGSGNVTVETTSCKMDDTILDISNQSIKKLSDVSKVNPTNGQIYKWNSTTNLWEPSSIGLNDLPTLDTLTNKDYRAGEDMVAGEAVFLESVPTNMAVTETTEAANTLNSWGGTFTDSRGYRIQANANIFVYKVTKDSAVTCTRALIKSDTGNTILATATFVGDVATFSTPYYVTSGTIVRVELDNNGSSWQPKYASTSVNRTNINFLTGSVSGANDASYGWNIVSITIANPNPDGTMNVGDVSANTRQSMRFIGNGTSFNSLQVVLKKVLSPSTSFELRIESDDGSGSPSGTLIDPSAYASIVAANISTAWLWTTMTLAGSVTIPLGTPAHYVWKQTGDTVNASNYYQLGYFAIHSTSRTPKKYNGSAWSNTGLDQFYYVSCTGMLQTVLSKTDADYTYKLDFYGFVTGNTAVGLLCSVAKQGIPHLFSGGLYGRDMYLGNTPGAISSSPGTNRKYIGTYINDTGIHLGYRTIDYASATNYTNNTAYYAYTDGFVIAANTAATSFTLVGYTGSTSATTDEIIRASSAGASANQIYQIMLPVKKGQYWKVNSSAGVSSLKFISLGV